MVTRSSLFSFLAGGDTLTHGAEMLLQRETQCMLGVCVLTRMFVFVGSG